PVNRGIAAELLRSSLTSRRLSGARFFSQNAVSTDLETLRAALARETVSWIRLALQQAIELASGRAIEIEDLAEDLYQDVDGAYLKAVEDTTRQLLHELEPILGLV